MSHKYILFGIHPSIYIYIWSAIIYIAAFTSPKSTSVGAAVVGGCIIHRLYILMMISPNSELPISSAANTTTTNCSYRHHPPLHIGGARHDAHTSPGRQMNAYGFIQETRRFWGSPSSGSARTQLVPEEELSNIDPVRSACHHYYYYYYYFKKGEYQC